MAIRNQLEIDVIIGNGQESLGNLSYRIVVERESGRYDKRAHQDKVYRCILLHGYLHAIIDPDTEDIRSYLVADDVKLNKLLDAVYKLSDIFDVPAVPITGRRRLPLILDQVGQPGSQGLPGVDGQNANIIVEGDPTYDNMSVIEEVAGLVKTYKIGYAPYTVPTLSVAIQGSKLREIGVVVATLTVIITSTKGRETIIRREVVAPGGFTLSNPGLNNPGPQAENIFASNVAVTTTFTADVEDDRSTISSSDTITFVYPFLYGASDNLTPSPDFYQGLTKLVATKSDKSILFDGINKYFMFGYPSSYGSLTRILDQNGFNVTAEFDEITESVSSANLDSNWIGVSYKFYRTKLKTTINSGTYTFDFP